ncbi:MAG: DUF2203 domain-containing protein [Gemmataceae bacterium]
MAPPQPTAGKKYFTAAQANATLPLVRAIVTDITQLAQELRERHERLARVLPRDSRIHLDALHEEEIQHIQEEFERDQERMQAYEEELRRLGVELKDYYIGLIDFPCWMNGREVYLCWKLGEPEVGHWHEIDAGFAGRRKLSKTGLRGPAAEVSLPGTGG